MDGDTRVLEDGLDGIEIRSYIISQFDGSRFKIGFLFD